MRLFLTLISFFICFTALAYHDGTQQGHSYNGKTFECPNFEKIEKMFNEHPSYYSPDIKEVITYEMARCHLHIGHLTSAFYILENSADPSKMDPSRDRLTGYHPSAILLSEFYLSDEFKLPPRKMTKNEENIKKGIEYHELALAIIRFRYDDNPTDDEFTNNPAGNDFTLEKKNLLYLSTSSDLIDTYLNQFAIRTNNYLNDGNIGIAPLAINSLRNAKEAANKCIGIPKNTNVWDEDDEDVYNAVMDLCEKKRELSQELLDLAVIHDHKINKLESLRSREDYNIQIYREINSLWNRKQDEINEIYHDELMRLLRFRDVQFGL